MLAAPCFPEEDRRQKALDEQDVLDTPAELYLDTLVRLTQELFQVETVLISLVDRNRQWFKARIGLNASETARDISFCGHAILGDGPLLIPDARTDSRFSDNPLVVGAPFIRFYAGQPLFSSNALPIGTLCMLDPKPRTLNQQELFRLRDLATLAEGYLQLRGMAQQTQNLRRAVDREQRKALIDPLTQLWNRGALSQFFPKEMARVNKAGLRLGVIYADLDHFKRINDQHGHAAGDQVLWESSRRMTAALRPDDLLVRIGGEEFVALVAVHDGEELNHIAERLRRCIAEKPMRAAGQELTQTISAGTLLVSPEQSQNEALDLADRALYRAKQNGRNRVESAN
ncbi:sensor domain-containing diguanylate cyclase [Pseudomonas solani]|uniref:sensor domain-containing diguanylate cyclase n=1 Tax=Pseudomonas TaxID=286 RepID=UPI0021E0D121|nr:sensor domain-containing diguanylate cyclase [Pseudomonas sp. PDM13]MCU9951175.1 sensor domain-containing diguanylate cyclase [Pseudomonas sp. PDM13]